MLGTSGISSNTCDGSENDQSTCQDGIDRESLDGILDIEKEKYSEGNRVDVEQQAQEDTADALSIGGHHDKLKDEEISKIADYAPGDKIKEDSVDETYSRAKAQTYEELSKRSDADEQVEKEQEVFTDTTNEAKKSQGGTGVSDTLKSVLNTTLNSNSTILHWLKYIIDPFLEEFKDGIYPNSQSNVTDIANTSIPDNETVEVDSVNTTAVEMLNTTEVEPTNTTTDSGKKVKFQCEGRNVTDNSNATVQLTTTAKLLQMLNFDKNSTENVTDCLLVMFYAPWCHFCAQTAPHYNALARAFPQLDFVAVDTAQFSK